MNKRNLIIASVGAVVLLGAGAAMLLRNRNATDDSGTPPSAPPPMARKAPPTQPGAFAAHGPGSAKAPGTVGARKPGGPQSAHPGSQALAKKGAPGSGGAPRGGIFGSAPAPARPGSPATVASNGTPAPGATAMAHVPKSSRDPFLVTWRVLPPPPYVFNDVEPVRLASNEIVVAPTKPYEVREEPQLRVSGIMSGDGVYAILEGPGGRADIVRPGSQVEITTGQTKRTYRVVSINEDTVKLQSKEGAATYTQIVPLSDVQPGAQPTAGYPAGGGMPNSSGFGGRPPRGGGRPGGPGTAPQPTAAD